MWDIPTAGVFTPQGGDLYHPTLVLWALIQEEEEEEGTQTRIPPPPFLL